MPTASKWGISPRDSVAGECARVGESAVVEGCIALLRSQKADSRLILALGGRPARWAAGFNEPAGPDYWLRVWAARGLLWAWDEAAGPVIVDALSDEAWRVREMALRVVNKRRLRDALGAVKRLEEDPNARVRAQASRAVEKLAGDD